MRWRCWRSDDSRRGPMKRGFVKIDATPAQLRFVALWLRRKSVAAVRTVSSLLSSPEEIAHQRAKRTAVIRALYRASSDRRRRSVNLSRESAKELALIADAEAVQAAFLRVAVPQSTLLSLDLTPPNVKAFLGLCDAALRKRPGPGLRRVDVQFRLAEYDAELQSARLRGAKATPRSNKAQISRLRKRERSARWLDGVIARGESLLNPSEPPPK